VRQLHPVLGRGEVGRGLAADHAFHVTPFWMPAATGAVFFPLLFVSVWVLSQLPPPDAEDEAERVKRAPMSARARRLSEGLCAGRSCW
jgi:hypothetical protein